MVKINDNLQADGSKQIMNQEKLIKYLKLQSEDHIYINIDELIKDIEDGDFND